MVNCDPIATEAAGVAGPATDPADRVRRARRRSGLSPALDCVHRRAPRTARRAAGLRIDRSSASLACGGSAIGPGSWPPANFTSAATRLSIGGWVSNRSAKPCARIVDAHFHHRRGGARQVRRGPRSCAAPRSWRPGSWSARPSRHRRGYSRERDSAKRMTNDRNQATAMSATAIRMAIAGAAAASRSSARPRRSASRPGTAAGTPVRRRTRSTPAMITAITSMRTSPLRIWVSSWPSTASISASSSRSSSPRRHRDRILLVVQAGGEGVERVALHHLELRHGDAARDAEIFQEIVEPRLLVAGHLAAAGERVDHASGGSGRR